jgi:hypothetical protein
MDWTSRMRDEEARLRGLVDRLGKIKGTGLRSRVERLQITHALSRRLAQTRAFLNDCLSGRNTYEQYMMEYKLRLEFPLYCHLDSIFSISDGAYADSDCA